MILLFHPQLLTGVPGRALEVITIDCQVAQVLVDFQRHKESLETYSCCTNITKVEPNELTFALIKGLRKKFNPFIA